MAESQDEKSGSGNWWGSWLQAAKEKSSQTLELIKHDLNEFGVVCTQDASAAVSNTSETLQQSLQGDGESSNAAYVKKGLTNLLGSISKVLTIPPDDESEDDVLRVTSNGSFEVFDKAKARLYEIQSSPQTYCTEPDGPVEAFNEWRQTFDLDSRKGEISDLLVSVDLVRSIYTKLVPSAVTHADFWQRYYYKVHQLEQDERRKDDLKNRADKLRTEDSEQPWEDDWEADDSAEQISTESAKTEKSVAAPLASVELLAAANPDSDNIHSEQLLAVPPASPSSTRIGSIPVDITTDSEPAVLQLAMTMPADGTASESAAKDVSETLSAVSEDTCPPDQGVVKSETKVVNDKEHSEEKLEPVVDKVVPIESPLPQLPVAAASSPAPVKEQLPETPKEVEKGGEDASRDLKVKEKRDYVILTDVDSKTPASSIGSANSKAESSSGLDDEWDKELFGEDLSTVREILAEGLTDDKDAGNLDDVNDDWETWD